MDTFFLKNSITKSLIGTLIVLFPLGAFSQFTPFSMWQNPAKTLTFTTTPQSFHNKICSNIVTVRTTIGGASPEPVASDLTVNLSTTSGLTYYSDSNCTTPITSVTILTGQTDASYYFLHTGTGTITMTATATNWKDGSQDATLTANPFVWTGGGAPSTDWGTAANWSGGSAAPGNSDIAIFDDVCVSNCDPTFSSNTSMGGLRINSGYTGTIAQGSYNIIILGSSFVQTAGTFTGDASGTYHIDINNSVMIISGGTFTAPAGDIFVSGGWEVKNSPTVTWPTGSTLNFVCYSGHYCRGSWVDLALGSITYENITINPWDTSYSFGVNNVTVNGDLNVGGVNSSIYVNDVTFLVKGDVTSINQGARGNGVIELTGNASGQTVAGNAWRMPSLNINTGTNDVTLTGTIELLNYNYVSSGTFTSTGSTLRFACTSAEGYCKNTTQFPTFGNVNYNNIIFNPYRISYAFAGGTINVDGDLTLGDKHSTRNFDNGTFKVGGDVTVTNFGYSGSVVIELTGNSSGQTFNGNGIRTVPIRIDTGANPVTLNGTINTPQYTYVSSGTFTSTGSTLYFRCDSNDGCRNTVVSLAFGGVSYNNITFAGYNTGYDLGGGTLDIDGDLTHGDLNRNTRNINNGTILLAGNLVVNNFGHGGSSTITFDGSGAQSINHSAGSFIDGLITVNKSAGTLSLLSALNLSDAGQDLTITSGTMDMAGFNLTVADVLTIGTGTTLTQNGGTLSYGTLVNNGTLNP